MAAAAAVGIAQAVALGLVALRVRGLYFALVTLVWGFVAENCIFRLEGFTGGGAGQDAPRPGGFTTDRAYLGLCVIVLAVILLIDWRLVATKAGRAMQALRESPQVAANYGVNVRGLHAARVRGRRLLCGRRRRPVRVRRLNVVSEDFTFAQIALPYLIVTIVGGLRRRGGIVVFALLFVLAGDWLPELAKSLGRHLHRAARRALHPGAHGRARHPHADLPARRPGHADRAHREVAEGRALPARRGRGRRGRRAPCPSLRRRGLSIRFGGLQALQDVSLRSTSSRSSGSSARTAPARRPSSTASPASTDRSRDA